MAVAALKAFFSEFFGKMRVAQNLRFWHPLHIRNMHSTAASGAMVSVPA
jgi:hypothetical protein